VEVEIIMVGEVELVDIVKTIQAQQQQDYQFQFKVIQLQLEVVGLVE
jgi:hypothetical protein